MVYLLLLFFCASTSVLSVTFTELAKKSNEFNARIPFPTQYNRIAHIAGTDPEKQEHIAEQARNVRIILAQPVMKLIRDFLAYKKQHGSSTEKKTV